MKQIFRNITAILVASTALLSCSNDDDQVTGEGTLKLEFDNVYKSNDLAFNTAYTNSNGEVVKVSQVRYIISNVVLTKEDGTTYAMPKNEASYFIVNEEDAASTILSIPNVPAGDYTKVSFGVGVDEAQFLLGANGQGNLLTRAQALGMTWSWAAGYKFIKFEGTYTSSTTTTDTQFRVHTGKTGDVYNYAQINLTLPSKALVRTNISPLVHIMNDVSKIIDGTTVIKFDEGKDVMGGIKVQQISANNVPTLFTVHHVHND